MCCTATKYPHYTFLYVAKTIGREKYEAWLRTSPLWETYKAEWLEWLDQSERLTMKEILG